MTQPPPHVAALLGELDQATNRVLAEVQGQTDPDQLLAALDQLGRVLAGADRTRALAGAAARDLIAQALRAGVDRRLLFDRPFSSTIVRQIARQLGLAPLPSGRRKRTAEHKSIPLVA